MKDLKLIWNCKCPNCNEGNMFEQSAWAFSYKKMHKTCQKCNYSFTQEPGFYFGAMYFSYGITVAIVIVASLFIKIIFSPDHPWAYVGALIPTMLLSPINFRLSRSLMLRLFGN